MAGLSYVHFPVPVKPPARTTCREFRTRLKHLGMLGLLLVPALGIPQALASTPQFSLPLGINPDQSITYYPTPKGDRIPDFSTFGFQYGNTPVPGEPGGYQVPVLVTLQPGTGDQTDRIQAAIDFIATRPLINGFRGAVLLKAGRWDIHSVNRIRVTASGVVIRGEGDHPLAGTRLYAIGTTNENQSGNTRNSRLIAFDGGGITAGATRTLVDDVYIPGGTNVIPITGHPFTVGQRIQVRWPGSIEWQKASYYNTAAIADRDPAITFNRIVTAVTANSITLDAPITSPLDPEWGRGYVVPVTAFNYITNVGVSDIYFESTYSSDTDENHVWSALDFMEVEDGFVSGCTARHFAYSIAYVNTSTRKITINRSQCHDGISILQGGRRYSFVLTGEMGLVSNNIGRNGRHTFIINWPAAPGPNVFVDGVSSRSFNESGSHADWNNGGLWDNISELSATVGLQVKLERPSAFCVAWNVVTNTITFENMPLSPNWSFGTTAVNGSPAAWRNSGGVPASLLGKAEAWYNGTRMPVRSLYANQLEARLRAAKNPHTHQANLPVRINLPPTIRTPSQLVVLSGSAWSYQLPASNVVAAITTPNYSATGLPAGLSINATTGLISGTAPTVATETNYNLTLSTRNQDGTTTKPMTLTVRPAGSPKIPLTMDLEVGYLQFYPRIYHEGDGRFAATGRTTKLEWSLPDLAKDGASQDIDFPPVADAPATTATIPLNATSSAGLPVSYFVVHGPGVIRDGAFVPAQVPAGSKSPIPVKVGAYQNGRYGEHPVKPTSTVYQTFRLLPPAGSSLP